VQKTDRQIAALTYI